MKYTIRFREGSTQDFQDGIAYYENISVELADRFYQAFKQRVEEIEQNPLHHQVRYKGIRIANFKNFPFSIHFFIEGTIIHVISILHQKRFYK